MRLITILLLLAVLVGCTASSKTSDPEADAVAKLSALPDANPAKYRGVTGMGAWQNPYLIIKPDGVGLVDLPNNEIHILKPDEVSEALARRDASAWPYGRVVAMEEGPTTSDEEKAKLRANRGIVTGALEGEKVQIQWMPPESSKSRK